ncbi:Oidioi.mRNA.OKI2018_I69.PAR.g8459.t1.cds [Oikopleura dioica]|uniref:Oidioi.mRNA.OKI2018_I69.PAR.g8459.t1.cds n=1 Tax=Oikopleura dioica TaxID=34765 RepID=A0ABN7RLF6_OIKDI|nr:Oidioi.mRNA.OKI2018_I69.PAR.g8459.t1.cds [Oikopleura dioica]
MAREIFVNPSEKQEEIYTTVTEWHSNQAPEFIGTASHVAQPVASHRRPVKSPSATTDYAGFGLMEEDPIQSSSEPAESSRVGDTSLADEITSQLDNMFRSSSENKPNPIRPPKPSSIKEFENQQKRPEGLVSKIIKKLQPAHQFFDRNHHLRSAYDTLHLC